MTDEVKDSAEYKALEAKLADALKGSASQTEKLDKLAAVVNEIKEDRDTLKKTLREEKEKKTTDNASVDELKKLLQESNDAKTSAEAGRKLDKIKSKIIQHASAKGFLKNSSGSINEKLLFSEIDPAKYQLDDDGSVIGLSQRLDSLKESDSYMFPKSKKSLENIEGNPKMVKGVNVSPEAFDKAATLQEKVAIMKARQDGNEVDNSGMMQGMGKASV